MGEAVDGARQAAGGLVERLEGGGLEQRACRVEERRVGLSQEAVAVLGLFLRLSPSVGASLTFLLKLR